MANSNLDDIMDKLEKTGLKRAVLLRNSVAYNMNRIMQMFKLSGLPDSIPEREIKRQLLENGYTAVFEKGGVLYSAYGALGGELDPYYRPTICVVANPALRYDKSLVIGKDCEIVLNDSCMTGVTPLLYKYGFLNAENDISIHVAQINSRLTSIINTPSDKSKKEAEAFIKKVKDGELAVLAAGPGWGENHLETLPYAGTGSANVIRELVELTQYLKASLYNELGLQSNFNMKREAINSAEAGMGDDALLPLVDDMLSNWEEGFNRVNEHYGTEISVEFSSAWKQRDERDELETQILENQAVRKEEQEEKPEQEAEQNENK